MSGSLARVSVLLLAALALLAACALAACSSSDSPSPDSSEAAVKTTVTAWMPKDASSEPPWNGRFVQVDVTTARPDALRAEDWRVFVNGEEPELDKPASILPYAPHAATVAFVFRAPYGDLGTYEFRVVYAPEGGARVERSWQYQW
jgi:maltose-binding protein MalE